MCSSSTSFSKNNDFFIHDFSVEAIFLSVLQSSLNYNDYREEILLEKYDWGQEANTFQIRTQSKYPHNPSVGKKKEEPKYGSVITRHQSHLLKSKSTKLFNEHKKNLLMFYCTSFPSKLQQIIYHIRFLTNYCRSKSKDKKTYLWTLLF